MKLTISSKEMEKWDRRYCELAKYIAEWSKDPKAKVGAVLHSRKGGSVTIGYNGFPIGVSDANSRLQNQDEKLEYIVHAEVNAIIAAGERAKDSTIYVWGKPVCARCAGPIIQAGVKRVVALSPYNQDPESKWGKSGIHAHNMFKEAGVQVDFYEAGVQVDPNTCCDAVHEQILEPNQHEPA